MSNPESWRRPTRHCSTRSWTCRNAWASRSGVSAAATLLLSLCQCGPPQAIDRAPDANELDRLRGWIQARPLRGWTGTGRARVQSADHEVEGELRFVLDPPARARVEVRSGALFGMVGERVVVSLPGDEHVLIYRERSDALERIFYPESALAELTLSGEPRDLFELVRGRAPWPRGLPPADWEARTRLVESSNHGRTLGFRVLLDEANRSFVLRLRDDVLERFELWDGGTRRLQVRYARWRPAGDRLQPMEIRIQAAQLDVKAEFALDSLEPKEGFSEQDFEVY